MERVDIRANEKGSIGEAVIFSGRSIPIPVENALHEFIREHYETGGSPGFRTKIRQSVYFNATTPEGENVSWLADGRITIKWSSPEEQARNQGDYPGRPDEQVSFAAEVKTGQYAEFERGQKDVANAIAVADNRVHPVLITVDIDALPDSFHVGTRVITGNE